MEALWIEIKGVGCFRAELEEAFTLFDRVGDGQIDTQVDKQTNKQKKTIETIKEIQIEVT